MKRFWLVFLSLCLVLAFSASAMAVDVKFSGEYFAAGMYLDKTTVKKDFGASTAFYFQRLRLTTDFVVAPGLTLTTRVNIMERSWGAPRSTPGTAYDNTSSATRAENENIGFDYTYVTYVSPIGMFRVGYQEDNAWGTVFVNSSQPLPRITYAVALGSWTGIIAWDKWVENSNTAINPSNLSTRDNDSYIAAVVYKWKDGNAGFLGRYYNFEGNKKTTGLSYKQSIYLLIPYVKAQLGPVALQSEFLYAWGDAAKFDNVPAPMSDIKLDNMAFWVDATADFGIIYAGGSIAYVAGDDPGSKEKAEGGLLFGGKDYNPCLIMWNHDLGYWAGNPVGYNSAVQSNGTAGAMTNQGMSNAWFFQGRAGLRPVDKLDIMASVSYANADKKPSSTWVSNSYGWEADVTATYKITNNLSYMLGFGYLFTGDYYKGTNSMNSVQNDYLVINKLTLTF